MNTTKLRILINLSCAWIGLNSFGAFATPIQSPIDDCQALLTALRAEDLHPSSYYWEIDAIKSRDLSVQLSRVPSVEDKERFRQMRSRAVKPQLRAQIERERMEPALLDPGRYIERHFSPRTFDYLAKHQNQPIIIAPGDIEEVASYARGGGARHFHVLPKNSLTDFTLMVAEQENGPVIYVQVLPGRAAIFEALANLLHYQVNDHFIIGAERVSVLEPLHLASPKIAQILTQNGAADADAVFFGYSSNLEKVITGLGGQTIFKIDEVDLFARVIQIGDKKILSVPVTPYAFGDRAGELLRALDHALTKKRFVAAVGIAGTLDPKIDVDHYVVPDRFCRDQRDVRFDNLSLGVSLPAHRQLRAESVDSILQETRPWLDRVRADGSSIVEQEGLDLVLTAQALGYPLAAVYRISDRVGFGHEDFNTIEFSYQPDEKLTAWQRAIVNLFRTH